MTQVMLGGYLCYPLPWARPDCRGHCGYPPLQPLRSFPSCPHYPGCSSCCGLQQQCNGFQRYRVRGLTFFAFALESCGYLDTQAIDCIRQIAAAAASTGAVTYGSFVASVHTEISVARIDGNHRIFRAGVQLYTRASDMLVFLAILCPRLILSEVSLFSALCILSLVLLVFPFIFLLRFCIPVDVSTMHGLLKQPMHGTRRCIQL
jgi:hypothetical protein